MATEESEYMRQRRIIHQAIAEAYPDVVISGWVLVYEQMAPDGDDTGYTLEIASGDATGESDMRPWTQRGWLFSAAHEPSMFDYSEDDDDEQK